MPGSFGRFAIFYAPPEGSELAHAGAKWLGWDAAAGLAVAQPELGLDMASTTQTPRKYGLHGTLKPPMHLVTSQDAFLDAVETFAETRAPVAFGPLRLRTLGAFLAIVPEQQSSALSALAADIVRSFDPFRAPLSEGDLARRRASGLTDRQDRLLLEWGYPYVMDEFRFHITLTGKLDKMQMQDAFRAADAWFAPLLAEQHILSDLAVFGENADGRFHIVRRFPLAG
jgi:putative phosphonate metabolism protein